MTFNSRFLLLAFLLNVFVVEKTSAAAAKLQGRFLNYTSISTTSAQQTSSTQQRYQTTVSGFTTSLLNTSAVSTTVDSSPEPPINLAPSAFISTASSGRASDLAAAYGPTTSASHVDLSIATGARNTAGTLRSHNATAPRIGSVYASNLTFPLQVTPTKPAVQATGASRNATLSPGRLAPVESNSNYTTISSNTTTYLVPALGLVASATTTMSNSDTTTDALDILESAIPSSVLESIQSNFDSLTSALLGPTSTPVSNPVTRSGRPPQPTRSLAITSRPPPHATFSIWTTSQTSTPSTLMTVAAHSTSSSTTATPSATAAAAGGGGAQLKNASVAGIATGVAAGAMLFFLAGVYMWRRKKQGKPMFGAARSDSQRSSKRGSKRIFPESAWLYDPVQTPRAGSPPLDGAAAGGRSRAASAASLIPEPRDGTVELPSAPNSPPMHPRPSSPLLAPVMSGGRADRASDGWQGRRSGSRSPRRNSGSESPTGRRSRSSLGRAELQRPMSAIWEEQSRPSSEVRQGLLAPGNVNFQRHST